MRLVAYILLAIAPSCALALLSFRPTVRWNGFQPQIDILNGSPPLPSTGAVEFNQVASASKQQSRIEKSVSSSLVEKLPWVSSINPTRTLSYMPMFESALKKVHSLPGIKELPLESKFVYRTSDVKPARIGNMLFQNEHFRKIRMTYFDAGDSVQVFNACFYPSYEYDLPMLGMDLISLGKGRVLCVVDFQPLHPTKEYSQRYIEPLTATRARYPSLQGTLSGKIYDDTSFFSKNMLFGRFTDETKLQSVVAPALDEYVEAYLQLMLGASPNHAPEAVAEVQKRQAAYDAYSALKDPAVGLFDAYFGKDWSASFVHDYLFSLSDAAVTAQQHAIARQGAAHRGAARPPSSSSSTSSSFSSSTTTTTSSTASYSAFVPVGVSAGATVGSHVHKFKIDSATGKVSSASTSSSRQQQQQEQHSH